MGSRGCRPRRLWGRNPSARLRAGTSPFRGTSRGGRVCGREAVNKESVWQLFRSLPLPLRTPDYRLVSELNVGRSPAALSAAVTTTHSQETAPTSQAEPPPQKQPRQTPAALRERGSGGEALLSEKRPLPQSLLPRTVTAALSAAVTTTHSQETAPHLSGGTNSAEAAPLKRQPLFGERGSGGEALLSEKRPLPQNLPPLKPLREGARGRGFS